MYVDGQEEGKAFYSAPNGKTWFETYKNGVRIGSTLEKESDKNQ